MKTLLTIGCASVVLLCGVATTRAQVQVGYVNVDSVLLASVEAQNGNDQLLEIGKDFETEFQQLQAEFQKEVEDYQNKQSLLSDRARRDRETKLEELRQKGQLFAEQKQIEIAQKERAIREPIVTKIRDIIERLGKEGGYQVIIPNALFVAEGFSGDLTQQVIDELNKGFQ